jgi:hypothetical protein
VEIPQGNSLYSYLLSQISKNVLFFFLSFPFCKIREKEFGGISPAQGGRVDTMGRGRQ